MEFSIQRIPWEEEVKKEESARVEVEKSKRGRRIKETDIEL